MYNYTTKADLKNATVADTSSFAKKADLAHLKSDVDKLDIDELKNVPTNLSNLKSKVDKLDDDKLVLVPVDLSKLSDVVKNDFVKKDVYHAKIQNIEDKIPDKTNKSSRPEVFLENGVPKICRKFTGENIVALKVYCNLTSAWVFSCKFAAYFQNIFF